ncbi:hypothetical protein [Streptomyces sp. ITFR-6]|uniref:hypothetical protein n=1 Tax=Streptomyces sp. ITFR-6 TaxID=3075197 RepID=UPI00288BF2FB|nr:hypothetical protein [Streptomyces sp. ITFR-6]WNI28649.1 hypothetical protein RLT59_07485 [Streptomyces sp. ITFR-6]
MTTCVECAEDFDVSDAQREYRAESGGAADEYNELYAGTYCGSCAASQTESNLNTGRAIMMVNGDEDYDQDHVDRHL